jgi:hypothetical protein
LLPLTDFDRGPTAPFARHFARVPEPPFPDRFWFDWGPVFFRGRCNGTARVVCIGSDPGPTERIANRVLVGDAGQRVQGFLAKLGLTRSYLCVNAFAWALFPSQADTAPVMLADTDQLRWRNRLFDMARTPSVQAVVAFGAVAQEAVGLWPGRAGVVVKEVPHPSSHDENALLDAWRAAITSLRGTVTPDDDGSNTGPNYGNAFAETDYAAIPRADLPFGAAAFLGDDAARRAHGARTSVRRPSPDDRHTLQWTAPDPGGGQ